MPPVLLKEFKVTGQIENLSCKTSSGMRRPRFRIQTLMAAVVVAALLCAAAVDAVRLLSGGPSSGEVFVVMLVVCIGARLLLVVHGPQWQWTPSQHAQQSTENGPTGRLLGAAFVGLDAPA
jgi:hypothetical protein